MASRDSNSSKSTNENSNEINTLVRSPTASNLDYEVSTLVDNVEQEWRAAETPNTTLLFKILRQHLAQLHEHYKQIHQKGTLEAPDHEEEKIGSEVYTIDGASSIIKMPSTAEQLPIYHSRTQECLPQTTSATELDFRRAMKVRSTIVECQNRIRHLRDIGQWTLTYLDDLNLVFTDLYEQDDIVSSVLGMDLTLVKIQRANALLHLFGVYGTVLSDYVAESEENVCLLQPIVESNRSKQELIMRYVTDRNPDDEELLNEYMFSSRGRVGRLIRHYVDILSDDYVIEENEQGYPLVLVSIKVATQVSGLSDRRLTEVARDKRFPSFRFPLKGNRVYIALNDINTYLNSRSKGGRPRKTG